MSETKPRFGLTDKQQSELSTIYDTDLLRDKVVLVSGAGSGIGKAIAFLFSRLGAKLYICGRKLEKLETTIEAIESWGGEVHAKAMSIREPEQVSELMDDVWKTYGQLDILVNNAGGQFPGLAIDFSLKGWKAVIDTNLNGTWYMMQAAAKQWRDHQQPGNIINITAAISRGLTGMAHTAAARAGVNFLTKTVAVEWAPYNIRVNCVAPGAIESTGFYQYPEEFIDGFYRVNPMLRAGSTHDIAQAVVYLAADSGKFINGEVLNVDGGSSGWGQFWPSGQPEYFKVDD